MDADKGLKAFVPCQLGVSLEDGFEDRYIERDASNKEYIDHLLSWAVLARCDTSSHLASGSLHLNALFPPKAVVCWRGLLTKIMASPIEKLNPVKFVVFKLHDRVLLCEYEESKTSNSSNTASSKSGRSGKSGGSAKAQSEADDFHKRACFAGYRFETYVTKPRGQSAASSSSRHSHRSHGRAQSNLPRHQPGQQQQQQQQQQRSEAHATAAPMMTGSACIPERDSPQGPKKKAARVSAQRREGQEGNSEEGRQQDEEGGGGGQREVEGEGEQQQSIRQQQQQQQQLKQQGASRNAESFGTELHANMALTDEQCRAAVVNTNEGFCSVFSTSLNGFPIVSGGQYCMGVCVLEQDACTPTLSSLCH